MIPDELNLLEQRFPERRFCALTEEEASELGSGTYAEWKLASRDGVHIDGRDYLQLLTDGARWRAFVRSMERTGLVALAMAAIVVVVWVLGLILGAMG